MDELNDLRATVKVVDVRGAKTLIGGAKPLPATTVLAATTVLLNNTEALLVYLRDRKARDHHFVAIDVVEQLLATGRAS